MSAATHPVRDSATMLRRNLLHARRYPGLTVPTVVGPVVFLLLFVYVLGGALAPGVGAAGGGYVDYVLPGILLMAIAIGTTSTGIGISTDMTLGIINRFRTMAISRASVLTGNVVGNVVLTMLSVVVVLGVGLAVGFRPSAGPLGWLGALGVLALFTLALTWMVTALALLCKNVESASNISMPLMVLPFLGSAFVPTDSMPAGVRAFAEYQPFSPVIETTRGLLMGTPIGGSGWLALGWCAVIGLGGYAWAKRRFHRKA